MSVEFATTVAIKLAIDGGKDIILSDLGDDLWIITEMPGDEEWRCRPVC